MPVLPGGGAMAKLTLDVTVDEIRDMIAQLPPDDFLRLTDALEEHATTLAMMKLAETGFREWDEEGEDIYDASA